MKALKITLEHGRVWTAETSDGKRATGASLASVLDKLVPMSLSDSLPERQPAEEYLASVFNGIRDSGGDGQIGSGVSAA